MVAGPPANIAACLASSIALAREPASEASIPSRLARMLKVIAMLYLFNDSMKFLPSVSHTMHSMYFFQAYFFLQTFLLTECAVA